MFRVFSMPKRLNKLSIHKEFRIFKALNVQKHTEHFFYISTLI